jgi:hypothetical protein
MDTGSRGARRLTAPARRLRQRKTVRGRRGMAGQHAHALPARKVGQERLGRADAGRPERARRGCVSRSCWHARALGGMRCGAAGGHSGRAGSGGRMRGRAAGRAGEAVARPSSQAALASRAAGLRDRRARLSLVRWPPRPRDRRRRRARARPAWRSPRCPSGCCCAPGRACDDRARRSDGSCHRSGLVLSQFWRPG